MPKKSAMPPPVRALDAAKSSLQHLSDQERMITSRLLPPEDPVEAVFKPPESLPHSYLPKPPPHAASALSAPVSLKLPKALQRVGREASFMGGTGGPHTEELDDPTTAVDEFTSKHHYLGKTPLHLAAVGAHLLVVQRLLKQPTVDAGAVDSAGRSPLDDVEVSC